MKGAVDVGKEVEDNPNPEEIGVIGVASDENGPPAAAVVAKVNAGGDVGVAGVNLGGLGATFCFLAGAPPVTESMIPLSLAGKEE